MLDIMELRGFTVDTNVYGTGVYLSTPDDFSYVVQLFPGVSNIACAFACFESLNPNYK